MISSLTFITEIRRPNLITRANFSKVIRFKVETLPTGTNISATLSNGIDAIKSIKNLVFMYSSAIFFGSIISSPVSLWMKVVSEVDDHVDYEDQIN